MWSIVFAGRGVGLHLLLNLWNLYDVYSSLSSDDQQGGESVQAHWYVMEICDLSTDCSNTNLSKRCRRAVSNIKKKLLFPSSYTLFI